MTYQGFASSDDDKEAPVCAALHLVGINEPLAIVCQERGVSVWEPSQWSAKKLNLFDFSRLAKAMVARGKRHHQHVNPVGLKKEGTSHNWQCITDLVYMLFYQPKPRAGGKAAEGVLDLHGKGWPNLSGRGQL